jgi:hypothetical protein
MNEWSKEKLIEVIIEFNNAIDDDPANVGDFFHEILAGYIENVGLKGFLEKFNRETLLEMCLSAAPENDWKDYEALI